MKKYNYIRPILLIVTALLVKSLVTNVCMLLGMEAEAAANMGFMGMVLAALIMYIRMTKQRRK
ncbi:hypothetical protein [Paenibacillus sp. YN15]|uniref:hypothetical protein n=1 Tax=Paenibacillus sp. YN15 TaxID=1742774 RepID=UPI000DCE6109|nr:hypothetical protein [Paenibacillus sp. YN15]RAV01999.1 hypothetical protein DQG13_10775 [Paenibacillus sp. YN15]